MLARATGRISFPIPAYLIDHPKGRFVFDTGMHPVLGKNPHKRLGRWADYFKIAIPPGSDISSHLQGIQIDPADMELIVSSHLHFTHAGGWEALPNARVLIQKREWEAGLDPDMVVANNYNPADYQHGHIVKTVEGEHDIFGDGTAVVFPSFGHTPGSQSLKLKLQSGDVVLTSDACYFKETLDNLHLPTIIYDRKQALDTLFTYREHQRRGAKIFYGHDAEFWKTIPQSPIRII